MPGAGRRPALGVAGGLSALAGADLFSKLLRASRRAEGPEGRDIVLDQRAFAEPAGAGPGDAGQSARKLYLVDLLQDFRERGVQAVLLPCCTSQTFLDELNPEAAVPVLELVPALVRHVAREHPRARRLGLLASDFVSARGLFQRAFGAPCELVLPRPEIQARCVMPALHGPQGLHSGQRSEVAIRLLLEACADLADQGAELILPGSGELPGVLEALAGCGIPLVDSHEVYAQAALDFQRAPARPRRVGIVGGVGPGATVDLLAKIVRNTPARCDQDHIKVLLEQNPQIPDRTAHLIGTGADPTIALYATCKRLERAGADLLAIPCNTAHAFVARIQPGLHVPIVHMLQETIQYLRQLRPAPGTVGLLATDGTLRSRIYQDLAEQQGIRLVSPDPAHQALVMSAIYGARGVKAGYTSGRCLEELLAALEHLVRDRAADAIILGCTELPLLVAQNDAFAVAGRHVAVIDPTTILARRCVALVTGAGEAPSGSARGPLPGGGNVPYWGLARS